MDENKPTGSIRIRVETIHYFLKRYAEDLRRNRDGVAAQLADAVAAYERRLRESLLSDEVAVLAARSRNAARPRVLPLIPVGALAGVRRRDDQAAHPS